MPAREMNIATGLLAAAALTSSPQVLAMLEDRYTTAAARAQKLLAKLAEEPEIAALRQRISALQQLADFKSPQAAEGDETERLNKIFRAHESFAQILIKMVDDLNFNLATGGEDAIKISNGLLKTLVGAQISGLRDTLQTAAQTHLLTSLISEAAVAKDPARLVPIRERFTAAAEAAKKVAGTLNQDEIEKSIGKSGRRSAAAPMASSPCAARNCRPIWSRARRSRTTPRSSAISTRPWPAWCRPPKAA